MSCSFLLALFLYFDLRECLHRKRLLQLHTVNDFMLALVVKGSFASINIYLLVTLEIVCGMRVAHSRPRRWRSRTRKSWQSRQLSLFVWNDLRFRNAAIADFVIAAASESDSSGSSSSMKSSSDSSASSSY